jgi:hypothetical protein
MADAAEEHVELHITGERLAALESEGTEGGRFVEGGEGFGLSQGNPLKGLSGRNEGTG